MQVVPPMVSAWTQGWGFVDPGVAASVPSSGLWLGSNYSYWVPIYVPTPCVVTRFWWANGSSVSASYNVDVGLFRDNGSAQPSSSLLVSTGSTAQGTASQVQFVDVADTPLDVGLWWLAMGCSSFLATFMRTTNAQPWHELVGFDVSSNGVPLSGSSIPTTDGTNAMFYVFGFSTNVVT